MRAKPGMIGNCELCKEPIPNHAGAIGGVAAGSTRLVVTCVECAPAPDDPFWNPGGAIPTLVTQRGD